MKIKVKYGVDMRLWKWQNEQDDGDSACPSYDELLVYVCKSFEFGNTNRFAVTFQDDQGNDSTISNQQEFTDAFKWAQEADKKSLKLKIVSAAQSVEGFQVVDPVQGPSNEMKSDDNPIASTIGTESEEQNGYYGHPPSSHWYGYPPHGPPHGPPPHFHGPPPHGPPPYFNGDAVEMEEKASVEAVTADNWSGRGCGRGRGRGGCRGRGRGLGRGRGHHRGHHRGRHHHGHRHGPPHGPPPHFHGPPPHFNGSFSENGVELDDKVSVESVTTDNWRGRGRGRGGCRGRGRGRGRGHHRGHHGHHHGHRHGHRGHHHGHHGHHQHGPHHGPTPDEVVAFLSDDAAVALLSEVLIQTFDALKESNFELPLTDTLQAMVLSDDRYKVITEHKVWPHFIHGLLPHAAPKIMFFINMMRMNGGGQGINSDVVKQWIPTMLNVMKENAKKGQFGGRGRGRGRGQGHGFHGGRGWRGHGRGRRCGRGRRGRGGRGCGRRGGFGRGPWQEAQDGGAVTMEAPFEGGAPNRQFVPSAPVNQPNIDEAAEVESVDDPVVAFEYTEELVSILNMGFSDMGEIKRLLTEHNGNKQHVVQELVSVQ